MKVIDSKENEDGSLTLNLDITEEEARCLIEVGVMTILKEYIEEHHDEN
jgi:hypothetical protein